MEVNGYDLIGVSDVYLGELRVDIHRVYLVSVETELLENPLALSSEQEICNVLRPGSCSFPARKYRIPASVDS